jgi:hypothetical protein
MKRAWRVRGAILVALALGACDLGPSNAGKVSGSIAGGALGAVVLDVTWRGVAGFDGEGSTQVYWAPVPDVADRYRVILVGPAAGELPFSVKVDRVYTESPVVTVVEATGADNLPVSVTDLRVVLGR